MRQSSRWMAAILIIAGLALPGCTKTAGETANDESGPARVVSVGSTGAKRLTLTQQAADRLAIQTVTVRGSRATPPGGGKSAIRKVIPYEAVLYDVNGTTWVYTMPEPLTFVRGRVAVDYIEGDLAVLSSGPPSGTAIVTAGAAELYGTELGVGEE
jgi:hypothetical protein